MSIIDRKLKILLGGSYHAGNLGDLALMDTYIKRIKSDFPNSKLTVFSYNPQFVRDTYPTQVDTTYFVINGFRTAFEILRNDAYILGGGGLIFDHSTIDSLMLAKKSQIIHWTTTSLFAKLFGKKVIWSGLGVGPVKTGLTKFLLRLVVPLIDSITVRDRDSFNLLEQIVGKDLPNLKQTADIVWTWRSNPPFKQHTLGKVEKIVLSPRVVGASVDHRIVRKFVKIVTKLNKANRSFQIIPTNPKKDLKICREIYNQIKDFATVDFEEDISKITLEYLYSEIGSSSLVISMRMHGLIFAAVQGIPGIGIDHQTPKIASLARLLIGVKSFLLTDHSLDMAANAESFLRGKATYQKELLDRTSKLAEIAERNLDEIKTTLENAKLKKSKLVKTLVQILISGLLFYILSTRINLGDSLNIIKSADFSLILAALGLRILAIYPTSSIWRRSLYFLAKKNPQFTIKQRIDTYMTYLQSYFFDNFGLGSLGGDVFRASKNSKDLGVIASAGSVILERASGFAYLLWLAISIYFQRFILENSDIEVSVALLIAGFFVTPAITTLGLKTITWGQKIFGGLFSKIKPLKQVVEFHIQPDYKTAFQINLSVAMFYLISAFAFLLTSRSVGTELQFFDSLFIFTTLLFVSSIPISYQGIGLRDVSLAGLLTLLSQNADTAIAISTILLIQKILISLVGGLVYVSSRLRSAPES